MKPFHFPANLKVINADIRCFNKNHISYYQITVPEEFGTSIRSIDLKNCYLKYNSLISKTQLSFSLKIDPDFKSGFMVFKNITGTSQQNRTLIIIRLNIPLQLSKTYHQKRSSINQGIHLISQFLAYALRLRSIKFQGNILTTYGTIGMLMMGCIRYSRIERYSL